MSNVEHPMSNTEGLGRPPSVRRQIADARLQVLHFDIRHSPLSYRRRSTARPFDGLLPRNLDAAKLRGHAVHRVPNVGDAGKGTQKLRLQGLAEHRHTHLLSG